MNISIEDYINKNYTQDMKDVLMKMFSLLERLNINTYEDYFLEKLNNLNDQDINYLDLEFVTYLEGFLLNLQKEFGFILSDNLTFEQRIDFVKAYVDLEDYTDHEDIVRIFESDLNDNEKLAECISLTYPTLGTNNTAKDADNILAMILEIDEAALLTIKRLHIFSSNNENDDELEVPVVDDNQILQIKAYELFFKEVTTIDSFDLIRSGYAIGLPFKIYWDVRKEELIEQETINLVHFSREIFGIFLLSKEYWQNPLLAFNEISEDLFDNIKTIQEVNNHLKTILNDFIKFKVENRIK